MLILDGSLSQNGNISKHGSKQCGDRLDRFLTFSDWVQTFFTGFRGPYERENSVVSGFRLVTVLWHSDAILLLCNQNS